jgi:hypothetical protein
MSNRDRNLQNRVLRNNN